MRRIFGHHPTIHTRRNVVVAEQTSSSPSCMSWTPLGKHAGCCPSGPGAWDAETPTSYLLIVWSEWDPLQGFEGMSTAIQEDLRGTQAGHHREGPLHHLDDVFEQLDLESEHLRQRNPDMTEAQVKLRKGKYRKLRETLRTVDGRAVNDPIYEPLIGSSGSVHSMYSHE